MAYDKALIAGKLRRWETYLNNYRLPFWEDIPDFGLYMEQVISLLRSYLDYLPPELKEEQVVTAAKNDRTCALGHVVNPRETAADGAEVPVAVRLCIPLIEERKVEIQSLFHCGVKSVCKYTEILLIFLTCFVKF